MPVRVQTEDFDLTTEMAELRAGFPKIGAVVSFVGTVRDLNEGEQVAEMELEHYPGMTEKALEDIVTQARARWDLFDALIIHRVGPLKPLDQIVLVAVTSAHRGEAFAACEFIIDYLKIHFIVVLYAFTAILGNATQANALTIVFFRCVIAALGLVGILYYS